MTCLLGVALAGMFVLDNLIETQWLRNVGYAVSLVIGAIAVGLTLLRLDELRQVRKWNNWPCLHCGEKYKIKEFGDVKSWRSKEKGGRAGVLLSCAQCGDETAFDEQGNPRGSDAGGS